MEYILGYPIHPKLVPNFFLMRSKALIHSFRATTTKLCFVRGGEYDYDVSVDTKNGVITLPENDPCKDSLFLQIARLALYQTNNDFYDDEICESFFYAHTNICYSAA